MKLNILYISIIVSHFLNANPVHYSDTTFRVEIDPVVIQLDSMYNAMFKKDPRFVNEDVLFQSINYPIDQLPSYNDIELQKRLKYIPSRIPMTFTREVKSCIEAFAYKKRGLMTRCLANGQIYFPLFEEILDKKGLPAELKYLPIVESALNPNAVSRAGATGLWQIMHSTGTWLGLEINSYVDERRDPIASTEAAADFLQKLYNLYGDWHLVLAAYNSGPGNVNKAIARAGGKRDFWEIMYYLPKETRSYVPLFIGAVYVMHYHNDYKILSAKPRRELYTVDTVMVYEKVSLNHISQTLGLQIEELQALNPCFKTGIIPRSQNGYPLNIPSTYQALFETRKVQIMNDPTMIEPSYALVEEKIMKWIVHRVRSNETISKIASRYNATTSEIKKWNRLKSTKLQKGQKLKIQVWEKRERYVEQTPGSAVATSNQTWQIPTLSSDYSKYDNSDPNLVTEEEVITEEAASDDESLNKEDNNNAELQKNETTQEPELIQGPPIDPSCNCIIHTVASGETLLSIANQYLGMTVEKIRLSNNLPSNQPIKIGQKLKIYL